MKKTLCLLSALLLCVALTACGGGKTEDASGVDVDLTKLSSTMVYSEVYNMVNTPEDYAGKTVRMTGSFNLWHDPEKNKDYYSCLISDATACCAQGIEFKLKDQRAPDKYPDQGAMITVTGTFGTYMEDGYIYCQLSDATMT